jgi:hypothetical protein
MLRLREEKKENNMKARGAKEGKIKLENKR